MSCQSDSKWRSQITAASIIAALGYTPAANPGSQLFTNNGSFSVPSGVTKLNVSVVGGGGGGSTCSYYPGGAGGAGGRGYATMAVSPGQFIAVTVGGGGGTSNCSGWAGNGGTTSFNGVYATGGGGGYSRIADQPIGGSYGTTNGGAGVSSVLSSYGNGGAAPDYSTPSPGTQGAIYITW